MAHQIEGYRWREERDWEKRAWEVAYLLQPWSKEPIQPRDLLKPGTADLDRLVNPEQANAEALDEMVKRQQAKHGH